MYLDISCRFTVNKSSFKKAESRMNDNHGLSVPNCHLFRSSSSGKQKNGKRKLKLDEHRSGLTNWRGHR